MIMFDKGYRMAINPPRRMLISPYLDGRLLQSRTELKVRADCPDEIAIFVLPASDFWEFRTEADEAGKAKPIPNASR